MLNKIWQYIKRLFQQLLIIFPLFPQENSGRRTPVAPPRPTRTDAEYEAIFMQLLEEVDRGTSSGNVAGFLMVKGFKETELAAWLRQFGERLLGIDNPSVASLQELARRLVLLSEIRGGELGGVAGEFGKAILAKFTLPIVEEDWRGKVIEAVFVGDGLGNEEDNAKAWWNGGNRLLDRGDFKGAITYYDKALAIKKDDYVAFWSRGLALAKLGDWQGTIADFDKALMIKPYNYLAWFLRGWAQRELGDVEGEIAYYDKALAIKPDFCHAWYGRAFAVETSSKYNSLASEILQLKFPASPRVISNSTLNERGYEAQILTLETGLQNFQQDTREHKLGRGLLHQGIGKAHYSQKYNKTIGFSFSELCNQAINSYDRALETLTKEDFPEEHIDVLQELIKAYLSLREITKATQLQRDGTDLLRRLRSKTQNPAKQKELKLKSASFQQLTVDIFVQSRELIKAIETAEEGKNACLSWLFSDDTSPKYVEIQQLLNPATAAVYWHLSPYALHTFIIKSGESTPIVIESETESLTRVDKFEEWVKKWNQEYGKGKGEKQEGGAQTWRENLEETLKELGNILNIAAIEEAVRGIKNLILIPHRDLHRFPIHALFGDEFTISYLPSAKLGLGLAKKQESLVANEVNLLSIEEPKSESEHENKPLLDLPFATVESEYICRFFCNNQRLAKKDVTLAEVENSLLAKYSIIHFTGHASYNFHIPSKSALCLTGKERLRVENILEMDLRQCELVSLSACETAITGNQTITTEYVGLVSAFLSRGVSRVASTLWTVQSDAAGLVMMKFYQLRQDKSDVEALNEAARWLRDLTAGKLVEWYQAIMEELPKDSSIRPDIRAALFRARKQTPDQKLYAHPYYWAPFIITGITR